LADQIFALLDTLFMYASNHTQLHIVHGRSYTLIDRMAKFTDKSHIF